MEIPVFVHSDSLLHVYGNNYKSLSGGKTELEKYRERKTERERKRNGKERQKASKEE